MIKDCCVLVLGSKKRFPTTLCKQCEISIILQAKVKLNTEIFLSAKDRFRPCRLFPIIKTSFTRGKKRSVNHNRSLQRKLCTDRKVFIFSFQPHGTDLKYLLEF